jgi:hypothetical protein
MNKQRHVRWSSAGDRDTRAHVRSAAAEEPFCSCYFAACNVRSDKKKINAKSEKKNISRVYTEALCVYIVHIHLSLSLFLFSLYVYTSVCVCVFCWKRLNMSVAGAVFADRFIADERLSGLENLSSSLTALMAADAEGNVSDEQLYAPHAVCVCVCDYVMDVYM